MGLIVKQIGQATVEINDPWVIANKWHLERFLMLKSALSLLNTTNAITFISIACDSCTNKSLLRYVKHQLQWNTVCNAELYLAIIKWKKNNCAVYWGYMYTPLQVEQQHILFCECYRVFFNWDPPISIRLHIEFRCNEFSL